MLLINSPVLRWLRVEAVVCVLTQHLSLLSCLFALAFRVPFWQRRHVIAFFFFFSTSCKAAGSIRWKGARKKKKKRSWSYSQISRGEAQRQGADPTSTHVLLNVRRRSPVHADGTALPDIIWGNLILPPLPLERRSISGHMSTRFVRLFITINCCST